MLTKKLPLSALHRGIQMQHTIPYTPQQNDVVETKNHTLKEMENSMIQSNRLSHFLGEKTINCANYIVIFSSTKNLKYIKLKEARSKIKLDVSHFHVFGSEAWDHIPKL